MTNGDNTTDEKDTPEKPAAPAPERDPLAAVAFALGWQMAQLYAEAVPEQRDDEATPQAAGPPATAIATKQAKAKSKPSRPKRDDLPSIGDLTDKQARALRYAQIEAGISRFKALATAAGIEEMPGVKELRDLDPVGGRADLTKLHAAVKTLHFKLLHVLTVTDFRYGKAYGLGKSLYDTCDSDPEQLDAQFVEYRMANVYEWLTDLKSTLPEHAAESVCISLRQWQAWVEASATQRRKAPKDARKELVAILRRQGKIWRACLSGEKDPTDTLETANYVDAGRRLVYDAVELSRALPPVLRFGVPGILVVALVGVITASLTDSGAAVVGALGAFAGTLGISWASVRQTVGGAAEQVREPLWDAALDQVIVDAITLLDELPPALRP